MIDDSALWTWFVFDSGLPTQRAKALLEAWQTAGISLTGALEQVQAQAALLGLTPGEAGLLASGRAALRAAPDPPQALTWLDALYPRGLRALPLRVRPALVFYQGDTSLLAHPIVYLAPGSVSAGQEELVRETLSLLLGEDIVVGVFEGTPQAALAMDEATAAEGELLIFARSGLGRREPGESESQFVAHGRALLVSPLPPSVPFQPGLESVLHQVAWYASERVILTADSSPSYPPSGWLTSKPVLELRSAVEHQPQPAPCATAREPSDVLDWMEGRTAPEPLPGGVFDGPQGPTSGTSTTIADDDGGLDALDHLPPLSPEEILKTLGKSGAIPEVLRRRILKGH